MTTSSIHIIKTNGHAAPGKLADAEIHFAGGDLDGLKLVGFAVWRSRGRRGEDVSFPSRHFVANGERRSFSLLRWTLDRQAQNRVADLIRAAYAAQASPLEGPQGTSVAVPADGATGSPPSASR